MPTKQASVPRSALMTVMFTDIVNSVRIKGLIQGNTSAERDESYRREIKTPHDALVLACAEETHGHLVNTTGDGFYFTFADAENAVLCAVKIQAYLREHPIETPDGPLQIRIGLHTGMVEVNPEGANVSAAVDKASRVQEAASPSQVLMSLQTQALVTGATRVQSKAAGTFDLKGLPPETLYEALPAPDFATPLPLQAAATAKQGWPGTAPRPAPWIASAAIGVVALALLGLSVLRVGQPSLTPPSAESVTTPALATGSKYAGTFSFLPARTYNGDVTLAITKREGDTFQGVYATESDVYQWLVNGTVQGQSVRWNFAKSLKRPPGKKEHVVGEAYVECQLSGDRMTGMFRMRHNPGDRAELLLQKQ